ncbi:MULTISPECIES: DUF58 domain-containing protein [Listeria]|uniref:DUF58 domain-containing protein n=1 Tax=Listeria TaxID=1637 RepID=UPI000B590ED1|nr:MULTISPECIES: DUF58 domain-containing protein [Listeria]
MLRTRLLLFSRWLMLLLLYATLITYTLFQGDTASWFLTYFFSIVMLFLIFSAVYRLKNWHVHRVFPKKEYFDGDFVQMKLHFSRKSRFPVGYLLIEQKIPASFGAHHARQQTLYPFFKKNVEVAIKPFRATRGRHTFSTITAETSDAFGLIERSSQIGEEEHVTIYPTYFPNILQKLGAANPDRDANAPYWTLHKNDSLHSLREFIPGDRMTWIDWKSTAKTNTMMTREFENSSAHKMQIIFFGSVHENFEHALRAAYSFSRKMLEDGAEVRITILGENGRSFDFSRDKNRIAEMSHVFAELEPLDEAVLMQELQALLKWQKDAFIFAPVISNALLQVASKSNWRMTLISILDKQELSQNAIYLRKDSLESGGGV